MRWLFVLFIALFAQAARAQDAVTLGKIEAAEHCARCHPALGTGRANSVETKRFRPLIQAADDASTQSQLIALLAVGHAGLSPDTFSQAELGTLAAYLRALKW